MRITGVEITNYRGFAGDSFRLPLAAGENLLVYAENGGGKSSFYNPLKGFLRATSPRVNLEQQRNRDNPNGAPAIRVTTALGQTDWTQAARGQNRNDWRDLDDGNPGEQRLGPLVGGVPSASGARTSGAELTLLSRHCTFGLANCPTETPAYAPRKLGLLLCPANVHR
ncbi:MAG TPA: hypothetical protein PKN95_12370 [Verrucomicrobiota bacterium]|nr:hypothetical protein [Verrucomicrobiota bacterium]HNT14264.1 hypothetical protein [Verrucomicrobiota bacterium]